MHLSRFALVAALAMLTSTGLACQCFTGGKPDDARTKNSISEHLKEFRDCCGGHSDCDFPSEE
ncbi:hypothetical protein PG993_005911 [Apiospora rasikravindrae]|uniref:Uncharacterized protein n=1 Tax=Apiospora rasikravindrae TaxID=990691 RepID=A0ABR1TA48_9PEZI